tara:strand:- start:846 stop:980 length:135 start_codon:yes stop_codon:yes gene_type:complete
MKGMKTNPKCIMYLDGNCQSDYKKNQPCDLDDCPYNYKEDKKCS